MKVQLHPEAEVELYEAAAWYEDRRPGLGESLLAAMTRWLDVIVAEPSMWPKWPHAPDLDPPIRQLIVERFPYAIAYQANSSCVLVLAFAHTSRRPFYWAKRARS